MKIKKLIARSIFDSRGYPTVEAECTLEDGSIGRASVPSGASTGVNEAVELRDHDLPYKGNGVYKAIDNITNTIGKKIIGKDFFSEKELDRYLIDLDATPQKSNLGANATLAVSLAFAKARAISKNMPLYRHLREVYVFSKEASIPVPLINVLNGGKHASSSTDIQEWMIVPQGASSLKEALRYAAEFFYDLREVMKLRGSSAVGDEGGFPISKVHSNKEALQLLEKVRARSQTPPHLLISYAIDVAASEFFSDGHYHLKKEGVTLSEEEMISYLDSLTKEFPGLISIEDGLSQYSWDSWKKLTEVLGRIQLVGDDLFVTNTTYIQKGADMQVGNAVLIKPNQIGTLTETVDAIELAHRLGRRTIISHRSGETEDVTIAHLAVASGCGQIKTGSMSRSERLAKYNELLRIEEEGIPYASRILI